MLEYFARKFHQFAREAGAPDFFATEIGSIPDTLGNDHPMGHVAFTIRWAVGRAGRPKIFKFDIGHLRKDLTPAIVRVNDWAMADNAAVMPESQAQWDSARL